AATERPGARRSASDRSPRPGGPRKTPAAPRGRRPVGADAVPPGARGASRATRPPPAPGPRGASPRVPTEATVRRDRAARAPRRATAPAGCRESRRGYFGLVADRLERRARPDDLQLELGRDIHPVAQHGGRESLHVVGDHVVAPVEERRRASGLQERHARPWGGAPSGGRRPPPRP